MQRIPGVADDSERKQTKHTDTTWKPTAVPRTPDEEMLELDCASNELGADPYGVNLPGKAAATYPGAASTAPR